MNSAISIVHSITLLRFPFSLFLLPVSLFSIFFLSPEVSESAIILVLIVWHILVFPSSNGYNSFHDRDTGPIGGLAAPPLADKSLLLFCNAMDVFAIILSVIVNIKFTFFVVMYILASRLYSNRKIRLKKFPVTGFLIVFIFQGLWVFFANITALSPIILYENISVLFGAAACSFFIGALYPITQIYQHQSDKEDGVYSLSMLLGKNKTFVFSGTMFLVATLCIYLIFKNENTLINFWLFNIIMFPSVLFFLFWSIKSFKNQSHINFRNTMIMLILSSALINIYFILLLIY